MLRKQFTATPELKQEDGAPGVVIARFATLNVVDKDGDITLPGAFGEQAVRMQPYGHATHSLPIGKGTIREEGGAAIAELRMNLEIAGEHYSALKFDFDHGPPSIEWSYVFDIEEAEQETRDGEDVRLLKRLKVYSVDPVFLGAGVDTATVSVKSLKDALDLTDDPTPEDFTAALQAAIKDGWPALAPAVTITTTNDEPPSLVDQAKRTLCDVQAVIEGAETLVASLREKDETLTDSKREALEELCSAVTDAQARLADVLTAKEEPVVPAANQATSGLVVMRRAQRLDALRDGLAALTR